MFKKLWRKILIRRFRTVSENCHTLSVRIANCNVAGQFYLADYWNGRYIEANGKRKRLLARINKLES